MFNMWRKFCWKKRLLYARTKMQKAIRGKTKRKGKSNGFKKNAGQADTVEVQALYFKKTGIYMMKANGQILRYGWDFGVSSPVVVKWETPNSLDQLLKEYYGYK